MSSDAQSITSGVSRYLQLYPDINDYLFKSSAEVGGLDQLIRIVPLLTILREKLRWPSLDEQFPFEQYKTFVHDHPLLEHMHTASPDQLHIMLIAATVSLIQIIKVKTETMIEPDETKRQISSALIRQIARYMIEVMDDDDDEDIVRTDTVEETTDE